MFATPASQQSGVGVQAGRSSGGASKSGGINLNVEISLHVFDVTRSATHPASVIFPRSTSGDGSMLKEQTVSNIGFLTKKMLSLVVGFRIETSASVDRKSGSSKN
jgi:hypothetical protein